LSAENKFQQSRLWNEFNRKLSNASWKAIQFWDNQVTKYKELSLIKQLSLSKPCEVHIGVQTLKYCNFYMQNIRFKNYQSFKKIILFEISIFVFYKYNCDHTYPNSFQEENQIKLSNNNFKQQLFPHSEKS